LIHFLYNLDLIHIDINNALFEQLKGLICIIKKEISNGRGIEEQMFISLNNYFAYFKRTERFEGNCCKLKLQFLLDELNFYEIKQN
jgi:hypothetical protein